jgi:hypothetical protein
MILSNLNAKIESALHQHYIGSIQNMITNTQIQEKQKKNGFVKNLSTQSISTFKNHY